MVTSCEGPIYEGCAWRGDSWARTVRLFERNPDGTQGPPVSIVGATILAQLRRKATATDVDATFLITPVDDADDNSFVMSLTPEQTIGLLGKYVFDIQITWGPGDVQTYLGGSTFTFLADVSRVAVP